MSVDKDKIRNILESDSIKASHLKDLVDKRGLDVEPRTIDNMITALLSEKWTTDEFDELKKKLVMIQKESSPHGYYVGTIEGLPDATPQKDHEELQEALRINEASFDGDDLIDSGFKVNKSLPDLVTGIYWTQTTTYESDPFDNLRTRTKLYDFGFEFHLDEGIVHIIGDNFGKLGEVMSALEEVGVDIKGVGHDGVHPDDAQGYVKDFINDLSDGLQDKRAQQSLTNFGSGSHNPLISVHTVHIRLSGGALQKADLEGNQDIFDNDTVENLTEDKNGKIAQMKGDLTYKDTKFGFNIGYNERLGRIRIKKKTGKDGDVDVVEEAFEFVYSYYKKYYIEKP
ncbi:hypothetical protein HT576_23255 [Haloterrigena sp. SYSU A121-1]|uniref:Uncharacterized protein n=1 Tax=Haloterrigena gelatinilytica TaxID=2741724 RepID=A0A8J8KDU2_9EURY|nr:hypothetical protein [Haloterrigena gelatinilytica]NUB93895.1 hypothetical protein [Haloterrigena gelatinilytica]